MCACEYVHVSVHANVCMQVGAREYVHASVCMQVCM